MALRVQQVVKEPQELPGRRGLLEQEPKALPAQLDHRGLQVRQEAKGLQVLKVRRVAVPKEPLAPKDRRALKGRLERRVRRGFKV